MIVFFCFRVDTSAGPKDSPKLTSGDVCRLEDLFPTNPIWQSHRSNIRGVSMGQAKALYTSMVAHYANNPVSNEPYVGNGVGQIGVTSSLQSVFDDLIGFFEDELGFTAPEAMRTAIKAKQEERRANEAQSFKSFADSALSFFAPFKLRAPSTPTIRESIEKKLAEYRTRLAEDERWKFKHPQLAFISEPGYRDTVYKIAIAEAVLSAPETSLAALAEAQIDAHKDQFNPQEFWQSCRMLSAYLGEPFDVAPDAP